MLVSWDINGILMGYITYITSTMIYIYICVSAVFGGLKIKKTYWGYSLGKMGRSIGQN